MIKNVAIVGAGSWGTALSMVLAKKGIGVNLWAYEKEVYNQISKARENKRYLPEIKLPTNIKVYRDKAKSIEGAELVVMAVSSQAVRSVARDISKSISKDMIVVNVAKGLETGTFLRLSEIIENEIPECQVAILSGPSHAEEVSKEVPTTVVSAAKKRWVSELVQDLFMSPTFRVYTNPDVIGVEMGGALKNIIALGAGISDGLGYGDNAKAALMTRGIVEITRLGKAMGALPGTFAGLSGIGDLIVTCTSMHSRNRRAGIMIGQGKELDETLETVGMAVEGVKTCEAAYKLAKKMEVEMPITEELYRVLFHSKDPREAVEDLMLRNRTFESDEVTDSWL